MKYIFACLLSLFSISLFAQDNAKQTFFDVNYFRGNISLHNKSLLHLISGHPEGVILGWNKKTFGTETWHHKYNYPSYGASFIYQDLKNEALGKNFGVYAHYNFYFFKRNITLRIGQGLALTTNPYDKIKNHKNIAFGSSILSSTYIMFNYKKDRIFDRFGIQAGISLIHYSNANVKAPNTSVNIVALNAGVVYDLDENDHEYIRPEENVKLTEPIKYNLVFRTGINESDIIGSGQFSFYVISTYADKRLNFKSAIQLGAEVYFSNFLKEYIKYEAAAFPNRSIDVNADYKRVGLFAGHELFMNKISLETQLGYYIYYPFEFEDRIYARVGIKRYFGKKWFAGLSVKAHGVAAEAAELSVGIRL